MKVLIVGAGTMGHSLAQVFACAGHQVRLTDVEPQCLEKAFHYIRCNLQTLREAGIDHGDDSDVLARISTSTSIEDSSSEVELAIEAVTEDVKVKHDIFNLLDRFCPPNAILASNTSYLNIFEVVETSRPDKVLITHWVAPPHIIPLVEVVKGPDTSWDTVRLVEDLLKQIGKRPVILKQFVPGFIINRIQRAIGREALSLVGKGVFEPEVIDDAVCWSLAIRMPFLGVLRRIDYAGVDLAYKALLNPSINLADNDDDAKILVEKMVSEGRLGLKSGRGFYDYGNRPPEELMKERDLRLLKLLQMMKDNT